MLHSFISSIVCVFLMRFCPICLLFINFFFFPNLHFLLNFTSSILSLRKQVAVIIVTIVHLYLKHPVASGVYTVDCLKTKIKSKWHGFRRTVSHWVSPPDKNKSKFYIRIKLIFYKIIESYIIIHFLHDVGLTVDEKYSWRIFLLEDFINSNRA